MPKRVSIPFFTDQNVPDSVGDFLVSAGHTLTRLRDVMATTTPDPIIEVACSQNGQVLVSHDRGFSQFANRLNITRRQYRESLHRIILRCLEPEDVSRLTETLSLIENEWLLVKEGRPMVIEIRAQSIHISR